MDTTTVERVSFIGENEEEDLWSWRSDPERNHSDLKIVANLKYRVEVGDEATSRGESGHLVQEAKNGTMDTTVSTTYHVHKNVLANGRRKGVYFRFLNDGAYAETKSSEIHVDFEHPAAVKAFEVMLDYMYSWSDSFAKVVGKATNEGTDIVALRSLADYFDVPTLLNDVDALVKKDMSVDNICMYVSKALKWNQEQILDLAIDVASKNDKLLMWTLEGGKSTMNFDFINLFPEGKQVALFKKCYAENCTPPCVSGNSSPNFRS